MLRNEVYIRLDFKSLFSGIDCNRRSETINSQSEGVLHFIKVHDDLLVLIQSFGHAHTVKPQRACTVFNGQPSNENKNSFLASRLIQMTRIGKIHT